MPFSAASRRAHFATMVAYMRYYGSPNWFNTVAPDLLANSCASRQCHPSPANRSFPCENGTRADDYAACVLTATSMATCPAVVVTRPQRQALVIA